MTREWSDEELAKVLASVRAESDRTALDRALARLAEDRLPRWVAWTTRPWALAAASALLVVSVAGGALLARQGVLGSTASVTRAMETDPVALLVGSDATSDLGLETTPDVTGDSAGSAP